MTEPELIDHADGVKGHFCIGRRIHVSPDVWEFWNPTGWAGHGKMFSMREGAEFVLQRLLKKVDV